MIRPAIDSFAMAAKGRGIERGTTMTDLQTTIEQAWDGRDKINLETKGAVRDAVTAALELLDSGKARVAEKQAGGWRVNPRPLRRRATAPRVPNPAVAQAARRRARLRRLVRSHIFRRP